MVNKSDINICDCLLFTCQACAMILGWCPPENDRASPMLINDVLNFTIFIKNFIEFPLFHVKHKNMVDNLKPCVFHPKTDKDCPIFQIDYILNQAEKDATERDLILHYGGVISVELEWDCNLDRNIKLCKPKYSFVRLDVPYREKPFSVGFNFRYASHWKYHEENFRTLTKAYGLRLILAVSGKAGKLHLITLTLNTGSIVGIFGLATFFCDIILLHLSKQAPVYRKHVFQPVHLQTRASSVENTIDHNEDDFASDEQIYSTNGNIKRSYGKTVVTRPLTLLDSQQIHYSQPI